MAPLIDQSVIHKMTDLVKSEVDIDIKKASPAESIKEVDDHNKTAEEEVIGVEEPEEPKEETN